ncbi:MAG: hypothetical protein J0I42_18130 [Bosea sp.]|uniref:hypothetical protein n=1 Tax=Bosea sp. (in: a-proteobacteria) TaxID=1871050 RepID=UPI001AC0B40F|nr:hypothetical protein [Bosea sp. (in: a-proteobacteria)]MBN9453861.1 hypothetical protein [Bosea sp. (in: a-proteobacteria)]
MSENVHELFPQAEASSSEQPAPILPIEQHAIGAALAAEKLRQMTEQMLVLLQYAPRDAATFERVHGDILGAWSDLSDHYTNYRHVLECKGQA